MPPIGMHELVVVLLAISALYDMQHRSQLVNYDMLNKNLEQKNIMIEEEMIGIH